MKSKYIWSMLIIAALIILTWGESCNYEINESSQAEADTIATSSEQLSKVELINISQNINDGSKEILNVQDKYNYEFRSIKSYQYKSVIYIRLREPLGEAELKEIAQYTHKDFPPDKRLLIFYLLPGTDIADGAWATSHYDPKLEIEILKTPEDIEAKQKVKKTINSPWKESYRDISVSVEGKFSNSATKDSPLWVEIQITNSGHIYLYLYEYSNSKPPHRSAEKPMYNFSLFAKTKFLCRNIRPSDSYEVGDATHSEGIRLSGELAKKVISTLKESNRKVYFMITMGSSSTYSFYLPSIIDI